jgi:hypothetical protein
MAIGTLAYSKFGIGKILAVMQQPFPELTRLELRSIDETSPVVPDLFLGGSAPRLQLLSLEYIPFPGLPKLLLLPCTLFFLIFRKFLIPGTFLQRRCSLASLH